MIVDEETALATTVSGLLRMQAEADPDRPFVVAPGGERWSYGRVHAESERIAGGLAAMGVRRGDHVVMMLPNDLPFLLTWFALARLGAVEVPVNPAFRGASLEYPVVHSDATVAIVDSRYLDRFAALGGRLGAVERLVVVGATDVAVPGVSIVDIDVLVGDSPEAEPTPEDLLAILYTSGTTGHPKGVMKSHRCAVHWGLNYRRYMNVGRDDVNLLFPPLYHAMSQFLGVMPALLTGSAVAIASGFSASRFWDECREYGVTLFNFTGGVLSFLWKQPARPDDRDNPVTRALGVPIPNDLYPGFETRFGLTLLPCFGTSESSVVCYSAPGEVRPGSSGRPIPEYAVAIADDEGKLVGPGDKGEILTRPKHPDAMMRGYYKQPELTAKVLRDLWYHTGDMGYLDADGYLFFVDRRKDAIRRRGENISSFEIERVVNVHPRVLESAAVGIPSSHGEEEVKLAVVALPGETLDADDLWAYCEAELPAFMVPRYLEIRASLPRTPTERVQKFVLREEGLHSGVQDRITSNKEAAR
ncbi:ATP-dependent acyl-CoA ligase [Actinomadura sp. KC345]|uniref:AMP-binding protein n=1 Tax=Actinomadura sp. KC345 TaxID=2530371 RepID=UPI001047F36D|nr:AMP-binding protein [Actinomadura sp. KC345]TDC58565.1 ATP-dependent acyl-CoA ligase [Actinomadura sp. KC345]